MIHYVKGDLFTTNADIIAHGCNAKGGFASGVAGIVAKKYPKAKEQYLQSYKTRGFYLGQVQFVVTKDKTIANCITQFNYLPRGKCHADYSAIRYTMNRVKEYAKRLNFSVAIPKIGSGLAGGDWDIIEKILEEVFSDYDVTIYYL